MDMQSLADNREAQEERGEESEHIGRMPPPEQFGAWFAEHRLRSLDVDVDFQFASDTFGVEDEIPSMKGELT